MADLTPILIKDLSEQTTAADTDYMVIGGADAKKIKWSTIINLIKAKLGIGTAENLNTASKEIVGAINELNTKIKFESFALSGTENNAINTWNYVADAGYTPPNGYKIVSICGAGTGWPYASVNPLVLSSGVVFVWYYKATSGTGNLSSIRLYITLQKI